MNVVTTYNCFRWWRQAKKGNYYYYHYYRYKTRNKQINIEFDNQNYDIVSVEMGINFQPELSK
jgi:hypothetical protein